MNELEENCIEMRAHLRDADAYVENLRGECEKKSHHMDQANQEIVGLQAQICALQAFETNSQQQDLEISNLRSYYEELIHNLNR